MKSITIHNLEPELEKVVTSYAKKHNLSLNKTIKELLRKSANLPKRGEKKADFSDLAGRWTQEEYEEFERNVNDQEKIFKEDWQ